MKQRQSHFTVLRLFKTNVLNEPFKVYDYPGNKPLPKNLDSILIDGKPYKVFSVRHCLSVNQKRIEVIEIQVNAFEFD
jgi:hypothetical protein